MPVTPDVSNASLVSKALVEQGFSPFLGTPCGVLAPLYARLSEQGGLITIAREDNAVGVAAGCALAGRSPVVLMQNSGLGQSVNAIASLVAPYSIALLLVVGMRGTETDGTPENQVMGRLTRMALAGSGLQVVTLAADRIAEDVNWSRQVVIEDRRPAALLISPTLFGWRP